MLLQQELRFFHGVDGFNHAEDGSGNNQEADNGVDEQTDVQSNGTGCLSGCQVGVTFCRSGLCAVFQGNEQVGEINAADQQTDRSMITSSTNDLTMPLNAVPTTIPTARSITLPRIINSLNSEAIDIINLLYVFESKSDVIQ